MTPVRAIALILTLVCGVFGATTEALSGQHFVPNSQAFWDNSEHWTTEYGPAYRDTIQKIENMVPCTGPYALCFHSGPEPLPCVLSKDGRFASCKCTVENGLNYVLISAIVNYEVYLDTIATCGIDGSGCAGVPDRAPVCKVIREGRLIAGAKLISTYSPEVQSTISDILTNTNPPPFTNCPTEEPKLPYVGCMTAPCSASKTSAECSCPVFWGRFLITQADAACHLGNGLVWSSSFNARLLDQ